MYCCSSLRGDDEGVDLGSLVRVAGVGVAIEAGESALGAFIVAGCVGWRWYQDSLGLSSFDTDLLHLVLGRRQSLPVQFLALTIGKVAGKRDADHDETIQTDLDCWITQRGPKAGPSDWDRQ